MIRRAIKPLKSNSFFLFGPRGTGKTTYLKSYFKNEAVIWIDLLDPATEERYATNPGDLTREIEAKRGASPWVVIDEVQKVPKLLDLVHHHIEASGCKFALTGSSARKLKRGAANLLAGRAFVNYLFPLTHLELGGQFDCVAALRWGTLPKVVQLPSDEGKTAFLRAYALTYLKEEVWGEQIIRRIDPFRKFLEVAAQTNGQIVNYTNIARDVGVDTKTVQSYFTILEDTLIGFLLEPYHRSVRKRQRQNPKFYFFDCGVKRALDRTLGQSLPPRTYGFGQAFEHLVLLEAHRLNTYFQRDYRFGYLQTKDGAEIDLLIERPGKPLALVEIKSAEQVDERSTRSLEHFLPAFKGAEAYCLSLDPRPKRIGAVAALPWQEGLATIGLRA